jgi:shikimate kinase
LLSESLQKDGRIIATGGGAITDIDSLALLKKRTLLVCLTAPPEVLVKRSGLGAKRPLLEGNDRLGQIQDLLHQREESYVQAHLRIDTATLSVKEVVDKILAFLRAKGA